MIEEKTKAKMQENDTAKKITLPYKFTPRMYQLGMMGAVPTLKLRGFYAWHRRCGKDKTAFNKMISEAVKRVGIYYYFLPSYRQSRKVIWDGIDPRTGMKFLDHIPAELLLKKN